MSAEVFEFAAWAMLGHHARVRFDVVAEQQPGMLPRLLAAFARRDLAPDSVHADATGGQLMRISIVLDAVPADQVQAIEGNLRQAIGVRSLLVQREITGLVRRQLG